MCECACAHTHTHTLTHKSVRMLRSWSGCWTTEHITSWNTPEREWIPARLGRNALHGISFLNGGEGEGYPLAPKCM